MSGLFKTPSVSEEMGGGGKEALLKFAGQLSWHTQQQEITRPCFKIREVGAGKKEGRKDEKQNEVRRDNKLDILCYIV